MKDKTVTPINIRELMAQTGQQQPQFDVSQVAPKNCEACGGEYFDQAFRLGLISALAPGNRTNKKILVPLQTFLCRHCGHEFGQKVKAKQ